MLEKQKIIDNKRLLNFIIKNNLCFGDFHKNKGLDKYIWSFEDYHGTALFNIFEQIKMLYKVRTVFSKVLLKKKRFLFLGVNHSNFSKSDFQNIKCINREIFKLCFRIGTISSNKNIESAFKKLFSPYFYKPVSIVVFMNNYKRFKKWIKKEKIKVVGSFLSEWSQGSFSNYHFLRGLLKNNLRKVKYLDRVGSEGKKSSFINSFKILELVKEVFNSSNRLPGAIVCFSRIGYNSFFLELRKLGIPVICIVSDGDSLKDIDYPLIGDSLDLGVFFFYQKILRSFIDTKRTREVRKNKKCF